MIRPRFSEFESYVLVRELNERRPWANQIIERYLGRHLFLKSYQFKAGLYIMIDRADGKPSAATCHYLLLPNISRAFPLETVGAIPIPPFFLASPSAMMRVR